MLKPASQKSWHLARSYSSGMEKDGEVSLINKAIEKVYEVVNSNRFFTYLDYPYNVTSMEKAYSFNPVPEGIATKDRSKILGLGTQMWGLLPKSKVIRSSGNVLFR